MATPKKHITTEAAAEFLHEVNRMYCKLIGDDSQVNWNNAPQWQKDSAINGVKAIISGKVQEAKDSHQLWFNEKNSQGWKYGKVKEPEKKLHPCMVHYDNLPLEQKDKGIYYSS